MWTETLSKMGHKSPKMLTGDEAGALGLSEPIPKTVWECKDGSTTVHCSSTAVMSLAERAEPPVRLLFVSCVMEYVHPKMLRAFRTGACGGGGQQHHLPVQHMRTASGFWKGQICS